MDQRLPALLAFAASLVPFIAFWVASPDHPASLLLALFAAGLGVWLACAALDFSALLAAPLTALVTALAVVWIVLCLFVAGPASALAFALWFLAATALGARVLARLAVFTAIERLVLAYLTGLAIVVALLSVLLPLPVHYPACYAASALAIVWWQRSSLRELLAQCAAQWRGLHQSNFGGAPALALVVVLVWAWGALGTLTPIAASDDLAYHLRLPYELLVRHRYTFDVVHQVWAAAPWAADLAFAIPFLVAGGDEGVKAWVAGTLHFGGAVLLFGLLARRLPLRAALSFVIAYLAIPLVLALNHTLHTEGPSAVLVLAIFTLWAWQRTTSSPAVVVAAALLLALLGAVKSSNLVACLLLGLLWVPTLWRVAKAQPRIGGLLLLAFATVLIPYVTAWVLTGNPVLPLFNAVFRSPYFFTHFNFSNPDFAGMFDLRLYDGLFLHATRFLETRTDVAGGLALFLLLPAALLLLAWRGDTERRAALGVAIIYSLVLLSSQQYVRYLFPVMGLGLFAASRVWDERVLRPWWTALLALSAALGVAAMPAAFWQTGTADVLQSLSPQGREVYLAKFAPQRALNRAANDHMGVHATVAYVTDMFGADLHGTPLYPNWLSPRTMAAAGPVKDETSAAEFFRAQGVTHLIPADPTRPLLPAVQRAATAAEAYARSHGSVIATSGNLSLVALDDDLAWPRTLWSQQAIEIDAAHAAWGRAPLREGAPLLVDARGSCGDAGAKLWLRVRWVRAQLPLGETTRFQPCLKNAFAIRLQLQAPDGADATEIGIGIVDGTTARVLTARARTLGTP